MCRCCSIWVPSVQSDQVPMPEYTFLPTFAGTRSTLPQLVLDKPNT